MCIQTYSRALVEERFPKKTVTVSESALDICNTFEQVPIKCARGGNPSQIRQRLQESVVVGRILNIVNASVFRKRSQLYSSQQIQFVGDTFR